MRDLSPADNKTPEDATHTRISIGPLKRQDLIVEMISKVVILCLPRWYDAHSPARRHSAIFEKICKAQFKNEGCHCNGGRQRRRSAGHNLFGINTSEGLHIAMATVLVFSE